MSGHHEANRIAELEALLYPLALLWKNGYEEQGDIGGAIASVSRGDSPSIRLMVADTKKAYDALKDTGWFKPIKWSDFGGSPRVRQVLNQISHFEHGFKTTQEAEAELAKFANYGLLTVTKNGWLLTLRGYIILESLR